MWKVTTKRWAFSAGACLAGGVLAGIFGSLLTSLSWIIGAEVHPWVRAVGTVLLILTIPLLILAGHCLDGLERATKELSSARPPSAKESTLSHHAIRLRLKSATERQ